MEFLQSDKHRRNANEPEAHDPVQSVRRVFEHLNIQIFDDLFP